jgi:hypothetical protein
MESNWIVIGSPTSAAKPVYVAVKFDQLPCSGVAPVAKYCLPLTSKFAVPIKAGTSLRQPEVNL